MVAKESIRFENVVKVFPKSSQRALDDVSFQIFEGEFITILGSSGCGKTTTLKMINRLIEPDSGKIYINAQDSKAIDIVTLRRQIGYVVQQIALFPHLTIKENIALVPRLLGWDESKIEKRVEELLLLIHLAPKEYQDKYPKHLSGGQKQRVGLARALAAYPKLMLLDEPFGAIDAITRTVLQQELKAIHERLENKTFILVTHDINEAFLLGNRVMIMDGGKICQFDTPEVILKAPKTTFVKNLLDTLKIQEHLWSQYQC